MAKNALAMFGSTSPSYIIMQSLDMANKYIADGYAEKLKHFLVKLENVKSRLSSKGFTLVGDEPMKITVSTKSYGYKGTEIAEILADKNIVCEFCDPDFAVFMFTPEISDEQLAYFAETMCDIPQKTAIDENPPEQHIPCRVMSVREAALSPCETVPVGESVGRVLAAASVSCPPAVPILVCGERIDEAAVRCFQYYGIEACSVVK